MTGISGGDSGAAAKAAAKPGRVKFKNDRGLPEIRIGAKEFMCASASAPNDHPHVYLDMGEAGAILCPYCATMFRYDPQLRSGESDPSDSVFSDAA